MKVGDRVWWNDPDKEPVDASGEYTIRRVREVTLIKGIYATVTVYCLMSDKGYIEAYLEELRLL